MIASTGVVLLAYANHWTNPFHFDDDHTIVCNPNIRQLSTLPRLLTDATAASVYPSHAVYRPLTYLLLAGDYAVAGGLDPRIFHLSTFVGFLCLLAVIFALGRAVLDLTAPYAHNRWFALLGATLFGVHPVGAQTLNYIIQRAEVWSSLGAAGSVALFAACPRLRKYGVYLLPGVLGILAKTTASIFPLLILLYHVIVERGSPRERWTSFTAGLTASLAATGLCAFMTLSTRTFDPGAPPFSQYLWTQPWVIARYLRNFVLPIDLSIDPGWAPLSSTLEPRALVGVACMLAIIGSSVWLARYRETGAIAFGLGWFLVALVPVTVFPLGEMTNDHRMFLPYIGLALATAGAARTAASEGHRIRRVLVVALAIGALTAACLATWQRNVVWSSSESVWRDAVETNPEHGRARMNLGVALMQRGALAAALAEFEQAASRSPDYDFLEVNLGLVKSALGRSAEAEAHFGRAVTLAPNATVGYFYYGRWLVGQLRHAEAIWYLERAVTLSQDDLRARQELMRALGAHRAFGRLRDVAQETLLRIPGEPTAEAAIHEAERGLNELESLKSRMQTAPSAEGWLDASLRLYNEGDFASSLEAAREALKYRPDYAEAFNNIAAAHNAMAHWGEAAAAAREALALKPDFPLARNNLAWAISKQGR